MKTISLLLALVFVLAACTPTAAPQSIPSIATPISTSTLAPGPSPTPTLVPLDTNLGNASRKAGGTAQDQLYFKALRLDEAANNQLGINACAIGFNQVNVTIKVEVTDASGQQVAQKELGVPCFNMGQNQDWPTFDKKPGTYTVKAWAKHGPENPNWDPAQTATAQGTITIK